MLHIEAIVLIGVNLISISQVSGFNLDKAKKASAFKSKVLSNTDGGNCKNIKCATEEYVCAKLRTSLYFDQITTVIKKCKLEYMKCNDGVEAIELPMKYCRQKQALDNARKASPNEKTKGYLNMGITRTHRRSKRSPDIATKIPKNILASKVQRKRLANKKPKIDYSSLYFGPKSRKDADAESSAEGEQKKETGNRNQDIKDDQFAPEKREKISLMFSPNGKNRNVEVPNDEGDEAPKRYQEFNSAEAADDGKAIALTIQTNNANRGVQVGEDGTSKESANRNQEVDPGDGTANEEIKISLSHKKNNANRGVEDESVQNKETANRNQEVESEDGSTNDQKRVAIMIETNTANRGVEVTKSAETDNTNRDVDLLKDEEEPSKESANRDLEVNPDDEAADVEQRQKIHLVIEANNDLPASAENDESNKARDVTMETLNDKENADTNDAEATDNDENKVVLMIDPSNGNRGVDDNEDDVDETDKNRDVALDEDGGRSEDQAVKPKAVDAGDDDEQTAREVALEGENGISGEKENREELKDNEENDDNNNDTKVMIESPNTDGIDVILDTGGGDEMLGGPEEDSDKNLPNRLEDDILEGADDSTGDGMQQRKENKDNSEDLPSLEGKNAPDYEDVDIDEYKKDCPSVCPARDVMVCARCKEGVYRTFLSICHLRMFNCKHPEEKLELVGRRPCMMSAPFMNDMPKPKGRVSEPGDSDIIKTYYRCKGKAGLKDPKCKGRAENEEAQKRRYKI